MPVAGLGTGFHTTGTENQAFFQRRIAVFGLSIFILSGSFYTVSLVTDLLLNPNFDWIRHLTHSAPMGHLLATLVAGAIWLVARGAPRSASALSSLDSGIIVMGVLFASMALSDWDQHTVRALYVIVLAITNTVVARAIIVPSTARRTLLLTAMTFAPAIAVAIYLLVYASPNLPSGMVVGAIIATICWCAVATSIATVGSRIIFGLQQEVTKIKRLGQYTLEKKIGSGTMGAVYKASHAMLRRPTAVKLLHPERASEESLIRFEREVQQTARLTHPNTVEIYDYGRTPEGVFYYAMEFLEGVDLETLVDCYGPQPPSRVVYIIKQMCGALAEAHGIHLIHRDIKPANIILCERGGSYDVAKVVDFGLVKAIDQGEGGPNLTHTNTLTGTPLYLAPETITAPETVDGRSDLYALAAVGYFLLTGKPVFDGKNIVEVCSHHLHSPPQPPSQRGAQKIPTDLEDVLLKCLAKDPKDRPQSANQLSKQLSACKTVQDWDQQQAATWWETHGNNGDAGDAVDTSPGQTIGIDVQHALSN